LARGGRELAEHGLDGVEGARLEVLAEADGELGAAAVDEHDDDGAVGDEAVAELAGRRAARERSGADHALDAGQNVGVAVLAGREHDRQVDAGPADLVPSGLRRLAPRLLRILLDGAPRSDLGPDRGD